MPGIDREMWIPRRFCSCAAGQAAERAEEEAQSRTDWIEAAREMVVDLESNRWRRYRLRDWDNKRLGAYQARLKVENYIQQVTAQGNNWLLISGGYGLGKTHLAVAALRKIAAEKLWRPHVIVWPELCAMTQEAWSSKRMDEAAVWNAARHARILLIDDLDKLPSSPWAMGRLLALVNYRYDAQKPTIITANHSAAQLRRLWNADDVGGAVLSRIMGQLFGTVEVAGKDIRW